MADRIQKLTLAHPVFTPADIKFAEYTPQQEDMSLLANSLASMEERKRTANEKISAMDVAFGEMRSKLHQDEETLKWFDNYAKNYKNQVNAFAQLGDYGNAINSAVRLAGEAVSNGELIDRIRTNEEYETWRKSIINNNTIGQTTKDRLLEDSRNQYKFTPIIDDSGNYIGGSRWTAGLNPVATINRNELAKYAASLAQPEKGSRRVENANANTKADGSGGSTATESYKQYQKLSSDKIQEVFKGVFQQYPGAEQSLLQDYDDDIWRLDKAKEELANTDASNIGAANKLKSEIAMLEERLYDNGVMRDPRSYMAHSMGFIIPNMAYDWIDTASSKRTTSSEARLNTGDGSSAGITGYPQGFGFDNTFRMENAGTVVMPWGIYGQQATSIVGGAINNLNNLFSFTDNGDGTFTDANGITYRLNTKTGRYDSINKK